MTAAVNVAQGGSNNLTMRNRIINGAMVIDQRNAGASVTPTSSSYTLDRWQMDIGLASKFSVQQVSDAPAGFINSIKLTVVSSYTPASDAMFFRQNIEGFNVADLGYGTSSAQPIAISFWVKASVTGTYSVTIGNNANNYSYISTYTVSSANTWQYITLTLVGPTAGTWLTNSSTGLRLKFDIGSGSNYNGTAGVWSAADVGRTSSSVVLGSNAGATWQITGVQLEAGTTATPFENRLYGAELFLCQRYYWKDTNISIQAIAQASSYDGFQQLFFPVPMRATPTCSSLTGGSTFARNISGGPSSGVGTGTVNSAWPTHVEYLTQANGGTGGAGMGIIGYAGGTGTASAEL